MVESVWKAWKKGFYSWEAATSQYFDEVLSNRAVLEPTSAVLTALMKARVRQERLMSGLWRLTGLPTRHAQERTLHELNQLHSRLNDLEEKLDALERR